jgi:hypothetical protein
VSIAAALGVLLSPRQLLAAFRAVIAVGLLWFPNFLLPGMSHLRIGRMDVLAA